MGNSVQLMYTLVSILVLNRVKTLVEKASFRPDKTSNLPRSLEPIESLGCAAMIHAAAP